MLPVVVLLSIGLAMGVFVFLGMRYPADLKPMSRSHRRPRVSIVTRARGLVTRLYFYAWLPSYLP